MLMKSENTTEQAMPVTEQVKTKSLWTNCKVLFEKVGGWQEVMVHACEGEIIEARRFGTLHNIPGLEGASVVRLESEIGDTAWSRKGSLVG